MKYDASLIRVKREVINGKEVKVQVIPAGMSGPNTPKIKTDNEFVEDYYEEDDDSAISVIKKDRKLLKEYNEYMEEGEYPESDEVRTVKEQVESNDLFESLETESY